MADEIRNVFKGRVLTLNLERVRLPNGRVAELEIAHHPGGAAVVALDDQGRILLPWLGLTRESAWIEKMWSGRCARRLLRRKRQRTPHSWH